jgi:type II secretory pathway component PulF
MPVFIYRAKKNPKKIVVGEIEAEDVNSAISRLKRNGLFPFFIEKKGGGIFRPFLIFKGVSSQDIDIFIRQLSSLIHSGLPLAKALSSLKEQTNNKYLKSIIEDVELRIRKGESFHSALNKHSKIFSPFFINIVRAGEAGGILDETLNRLAEIRDREQDLRSQLRSALAYPVLLIIVSLATIFVLLTFIIPRFVEMFEELGQMLPLATRILLSISNFFNNFWPALLIALIVIAVSFKRYTSSESGALLIDRIKFKLPLIGEILRQIEISRFTRTFGMLLKNGIPILEALKVTSETMGNKIFAKEAQRLSEGIEKGKKLSFLMKEDKIFPPSVSNLVAVGEESAGLEQILIDISESFERESQTRIKTFVSVLEPVLILILGGIVALIVISMLLPVFEIDVLLR